MSTLDLELDSYREVFAAEAAEHVAALESSLLELESNPSDQEAISKAFRAAHSIKGGAGIFGQEDLASFTHALETLLDKLRNGSLTITPKVATLLLSSVDMVRDLLSPNGTKPAGYEELRTQLLRGGVDSTDGSASTVRHEEDSVEVVEALSTAHPRFTVHFHPFPELIARGMDPVLVLRDLSMTATILSTQLDTSRLPDLADIEPTVSYFGWDLEVECADGMAALREVFEFVDGFAELRIEPVQVAAPVTPAATSAQSSVPAERSPVEPKEGAMAKAATPPESTVRIATRKLDQILDLVGELVIAKSIIAQTLSRNTAEPSMREAFLSLERHTRELQDRVMSVRMVPIGSVFGRFHRVVRELGTKLGKSVSLVLEGTETEIDRAIVEQLVDPLAHLVRNAIDHGLETSAERVATGKVPAGTLRLAAYHRGGNVVIEITDDGRGLSLDRVREKAIARGLLSPTEEASAERLHMLVFEPGFSTATQVSDVSGRGVGMDVVKRNVEALGGCIQFTSEPGQGSLIRLQLPLTMAIIDGLLLRVGRSTFVVPLLSVVESLRPAASDFTTVVGLGRVLKFRGANVPIVALGDILGVPADTNDPSEGIVCVVESGDDVVGLLVDELVADTQVVVKSLESNYRRIDGLSGAAVMGDGQVALILDIGALVRKAQTRPAHSSRRLMMEARP